MYGQRLVRGAQYMGCLRSSFKNPKKAGGKPSSAEDGIDSKFMKEEFGPFIKGRDKRWAKVRRSEKEKISAEETEKALRFNRLCREQFDAKKEEVNGLIAMKKKAVDAIPPHLLEDALTIDTTEFPPEYYRQLPRMWPVFKEDDIEQWWNEYKIKYNIQS
mmetsp:Transcript_4522/g.12661  ORF Transcript_4522/g.12661 Transcript_4522/m.12661 type:complete len:160 (+) Transcript_4522:60-539(+)